MTDTPEQPRTAEELGAALNPRQRKFAELYAANGNAMQSAIEAGYSPQHAQRNAHKFLENIGIRHYLTALTAKEKSERIADVTELREFWTSTFRNGELDYKDRLKASEMLGKSFAAFVEKKEQSGGLKIEVEYVNNPVKYD